MVCVYSSSNNNIPCQRRPVVVLVVVGGWHSPPAVWDMLLQFRSYGAATTRSGET